MKTNLRKIVALALLFMTASAQALQPEVLHGFQLERGNPFGRLVQGSDDHFYGTTEQGGGDVGVGMVFRITTNGVLTSLVSFNYGKGSFPSELVLGMAISTERLRVTKAGVVGRSSR
ncbi:MAG: hypothetical protein L0Z50_33805 [Verrucomicrobiales bacterium]|nr:hypothetical protein [Verrucomicrobiales bacterium]